MVVEEKQVGVLGVIRNEINAALGYQQTFEDLIKNGDVLRAIGMMQDHSVDARKNLSYYNVETHHIMHKPKKPVYDKKGNYIRDKDVNRISVPYQKFINEIALVFLYGRQVSWVNNTPNDYKKERQSIVEQLDNSEQLDDETKFALNVKLKYIDSYSDDINVLFSTYKSFLDELHFSSCLRDAKRAAGSEGSSALLFHCYQENGKSNCRLKVLSMANNDYIYTLFDQYDKLVSFAWGYYTLDSHENSVEHYDIYFPNKIYKCERKNGGWKVTTLQNPIGKIPVIVFLQEVEWDGVQTMIDRIELAYSKNADTNDNFADPALVATSEITNSLPRQEEDSKLYILKNGGDIKYLERSGNNEARNNEIEKLDEQIMSKTFTPDLSIDSLRGISNASGATLNMVMTLANIKADKRKDTHDSYLDRVTSLVLSIMNNVTNIGDGDFEKLKIGHVFNKPFGDDLQQTFDNLIKAYGAGGVSKQTFVEQNYLVKDSSRELELIKNEENINAEKQKATMMMDVFGSAE